MAKVKWVYPIEELHGKLKGKFGGHQKKAANAKGNRDPYTVVYGTRTSDPTSNEQAARNKFKIIATMVATRRKNAEKRVLDAAAFEAQTTYPTLTKYLWHVCTVEYQASLEPDDPE